MRTLSVRGARLSVRGGRLSVLGAILSVLMAAVPAAAQDAPNDERFQLRPTGYVQFDFRSFPDWGITTGTGRMPREPVEVRRLRAGLDGSWRRFSFELGVDPQDDDEGVAVQDAY